MIWFVSTIDAKEQKPQGCSSGVFQPFWEGGWVLRQTTDSDYLSHHLSIQVYKRASIWNSVGNANFTLTFPNTTFIIMDMWRQLQTATAMTERSKYERNIQRAAGWWEAHGKLIPNTFTSCALNVIRTGRKNRFLKIFWVIKYGRKVLMISRLCREQPLYCRSIVRYLVRRIVWAVCELRW